MAVARAFPLNQAPIDHAAALGTRPVGRLLWHACSQTTLSVGVYGIYALTNAWFVARGVGADAMAAVNLVAPVLLVLGAVSTTVGVGGASLVSRHLGAGDLGRRRPRGRQRRRGLLDDRGRGHGGRAARHRAPADDARRRWGHPRNSPATTRSCSSPARSSRPVSPAWCAPRAGCGSPPCSGCVPVLVQIILDPLLIFGLGPGRARRGPGHRRRAGRVGRDEHLVLLPATPPPLPHRPSRPALPRPDRARAASASARRRSWPASARRCSSSWSTTLLSYAGGAIALAAFAVCARIQTFVMMPQLGISQGLQPIVGYNAGRGLHDRVLRARTLSLRATVVYGTLVAAAVVACSPSPWSASSSTAPRPRRPRRRCGLLPSALPWPASRRWSRPTASRSGRAAPSYLISIGTLLAVKVPLVLVLGRAGTNGVWAALAIGEITAAASALVILRRVRPRPSNV